MSSRSPRGRAGFDPCSTSHTCTQRAPARSGRLRNPGAAAKRRQRLLHLDRLVVAVARAEELGERLERWDLMAPESSRPQDLLRLPQEPLGLVVPPLRCPDEPERKPGRRTRRHVTGADGLARLDRESLRFLEAALVEQDLGPQALALDHRPA